MFLDHPRRSNAGTVLAVLGNYQTQFVCGRKKIAVVLLVFLFLEKIARITTRDDSRV